MRINLKRKLTFDEIVEAIIYYKEEYGISYITWSKKADVSRKTITRMVQGQTHRTTDEIRTKLSDAIQKTYRNLK